MAVEKLIVDNIDTWTSALQTRSTSGRNSNGKIDLYGIKKLRELILELAVRGKLVPQNPDDEPASELLKRIAAEKARLVKQGKIKKLRPLPEISEEEKPFELPEGWEWVTLATVGEIVGGGTPKSDNPQYWAKNGIKWLTPADLYGLKGKYISSGARDISPAGLSNSSARLIPKGSVLFSSRAPIGYVAIADAELSTNQGFKSCVPYIKESAEYIYYFLLASAKKIDEEASGTTFKEVSGAIVSKILFPLPPLSEQLKIVSRANELISLCDQLEQQSLTSLDAHQQLVETLLSTLTSSRNAGDLAENWMRISQHFDMLFTTEASIDALKQTILQLAVTGKLVPQNPDDEPASELLKRIVQEKEQLVKEGKIKKQKPLPPVSDEEKPFDLPDGWEWCRLGVLAIKSEAGWSPQCKNTPRSGEQWGVLKISAVTWGEYQPEENKALPASLSPKKEFEVKENDFLISRANTAELVARSVVVPKNTPNNLMLSDKIIRFEFSSLVSAHYINLVNNSVFSREYYKEVAGGTSSSMKNVSRNQVSELLIGLPGYNEQLKIVENIAKYVQTCEVLASQIKSAQQIQRHLADVLTEAAIN